MRLIPEKESLTVEFKSDLKKFPDSEIFEAVVAFSNTEGGDLFLGAEDDGTITGVNPAHQNPITLGAFIANNTVPPVSVRAEIVEDEKPVLRISVPKAYGGVVATQSGKVLRRRLKLDGTPENVPMYPNEMATRLSDLRLLDYTALPLEEASTDDFDPLELERLRTTIRANDGDKALAELSDEELWKSLGLVRERGGRLTPTVAGILLIGRTESLKRFVPTAASVFQVMEGTELRINDDFTLPLLAAVDKLSRYLEVWNPEHEIESGMFRLPAPDFNRRALREAIVNAYSHRDYTRLGRVSVAINDDGIRITNPGGFIEGVSITNLITVEPHGRNPLIADLLKRVGLAERSGRGIDRIFEGSLIYGSPLPDYSSTTSVSVSLFIPRNTPDAALTKLISEEQLRSGRIMPINTLLVLNALRDMPRSTVHQIAEALHLSETVVKTILDKAVDSNLVEGYGSGRGRNYTLSLKAYSKEDKTRYIRQKDIDEARYHELILNLIKHEGFITNSDVVELLHVTSPQAYRLLKGMVDEEVLEPVNKGRYAKYKIKGT